jgi:membrane protein
VPVLDTVKQRIADARERRPLLDHLVRAVEHYGQVNGSALAAAVTYFAFLSFFPILALAFAIFGQVTKVYDDAEDTLVDAANSVLPGLIGGANGVPLDTLQAAAPGIFSVGIILTLYAGLGWLSGMRTALTTIFEEPEREQPSLVAGKLRDVVALLALGSILVTSVVVSGVATKVLTPIMEWLDLGVVAEGFEVLKQLSTFLLQATAESEAFQAFGIALILMVWINYASRVIALAAAWAHTSPEARAFRDAHRVADQMPEGPRIDLAAAATVVRPTASPGATSPKAAFAAGAATMLALVALLRRR